MNINFSIDEHQYFLFYVGMGEGSPFFNWSLGGRIKLSKSFPSPHIPSLRSTSHFNMFVFVLQVYYLCEGLKSRLEYFWTNKLMWVLAEVFAFGSFFRHLKNVSIKVQACSLIENIYCFKNIDKTTVVDWLIKMAYIYKLFTKNMLTFGIMFSHNQWDIKYIGYLHLQQVHHSFQAKTSRFCVGPDIMILFMFKICTYNNQSSARSLSIFSLSVNPAGTYCIFMRGKYIYIYQNNFYHKRFFKDQSKLEDNCNFLCWWDMLG